MGCSDSKSTNTNKAPSEERKSKQEDKGENAEPNNEEQNKEGDDSPVYVTVEEAVQCVVQELGVSEEKANKMVEQANKDGDGKVCNSELVELWNRIKEAKKKLTPKFEKYDKDKSGYVSLEEAQVVVTKAFPGVSQDGLKAMVKRYDMNGDDKINFNEFVFFYATVKAKKEQLKNMFNELDKDNSGSLDPSEITAMLARECALEEKMAATLAEDYDINKDGKLDKEEFSSLWVKLFDAEIPEEEEEIVVES